jgi:DDE superfamily endonuclease/Helix-turn-helix of DDE superfamily endonuclease
MPIVWIKMIDGRPPRSKHMTGLEQDRVDWLYEQVAQVVEWDRSTGCPRVLPLRTAIVMVLFALRHNLSPDVLGELFGCGSTTIERYQDELEILVDVVLSPLYDEIQKQARRGAVLVDGLVAPVGERDGTEDLFSDKKGFCGINIQFVATLSGQLADVGDPCPGARHDSRAFKESGIAERWAGHYAEGGPGMIGDKGYQGCGIISPYKKPPKRELTAARKACNTALNRVRAAVERAIAHLKSWKVLKTGFRRSLEKFPAVLRTVARLEVFRVHGPLT